MGGLYRVWGAVFGEGGDGCQCTLFKVFSSLWLHSI